MTDLDQARRFLRLLDPAATEFTFQTVGEGNSEGAAGLKCIRHGSFNDLAEELVALNKRGAGVHVTVNETDLKGRKKENVTRVRAIWQEDDDGYSGGFPLQPSMVVETSPGRFHRYWLPIAHPPIPIGMFPGLMARMIQTYGSDKGAADLTRVMRVPGFFHNKKEPTLARLIEVTGNRYPFWVLAKAFQPISSRELVEPSRAKLQRSPFPPLRWKEERDRLKPVLNHIPSDDRETWLHVGMALHDASGGSEEGLEIWTQWSRSSSKFDREDQVDTWRSFKGKENGITIASVFKMAMDAGWQPTVNAVQVHDLDDLPTINFENVEVIPSVVPDALEAVRAEFADNHEPTEEHWQGLRQIAKVIDFMAHGVLAPNFYVSFLPPGMGKTTTLVHTIREMLKDSSADNEGVIIFLGRYEEIAALAGRMELTREDYAVIVTAQDKLNDQGNPTKHEARVLFTTQAMLEARAKSGKSFAEMTVFHYRGRPRMVRIWDEAIVPARVQALERRRIMRLVNDLFRLEPKLAANVEQLIKDMEGAAKNQLIPVPELETHLPLEHVFQRFDGEDRAAVEALYALQGRTVRVAKDQYGITTIDYEDILPDDLAPMLILDASGRQRKTYELWFKERKGLKFLHSPQRSYEGFTIHHWNTGSGKQTQAKGDYELIAEGVVRTINKAVPSNEQCLVVHFKEDNWYPDIKPLISRRVANNPDRIKFCNWGRHTATNEYRDIKHVFLAGVLQYNTAQYEATGVAAKGVLARAAGLHPNAIAYWEQMPVIPTGRREPHACTKIRKALHDAGIEFVGHAKPGVRLCQNANYVSRPPSRARPRHGVKPFLQRWAMLARTKTVPAVVPRRKPPSPCGARTRTGAPCRRTGLGNGRCANHGGLSSGPRTPAGRARIAEVQRERWADWRAQRIRDSL